MRMPFIWAHRGASARAPENTLAAFRQAEADGADGVELDVQLSGDGVPVVLHDDTVDRTTDGRGAVAAMSLADVKRLDAGGWFSPRFAGERIPALEEVLAWAGGRIRLNLEIKSPRAGAAVVGLLGSFPAARIVVSSFDHSLLEALRRAAPALPLAFLTDSGFWRRSARRAAACGALSLNPRQDRVSPPLVGFCRGLGLEVAPWTVDAPGRILTLRDLGVDGLFTNDPLAARRCLGSGPRQGWQGLITP